MSSYFRTTYATGVPTQTKAFLLKPGSRLLIGDSNMYGSLDNASTAYNTYGNISIGLKAGTFTDAGSVASLSFAYAPDVTPLEHANIATASVYVLAGETCTITVGLQELKTAILDLAFLSGNAYTVSNEWLRSFGDGCMGDNRPISIEFTNDACDAPTAKAIANGLTGGVLTLYDCYCSSGITFEFNAREIMQPELTFTAVPVTSLARGNRLGSLWCY